MTVPHFFLHGQRGPFTAFLMRKADIQRLKSSPARKYTEKWLQIETARMAIIMVEFTHDFEIWLLDEARLRASEEKESGHREVRTESFVKTCRRFSAVSFNIHKGNSRIWDAITTLESHGFEARTKRTKKQESYYEVLAPRALARTAGRRGCGKPTADSPPSLDHLSRVAADCCMVPSPSTRFSTPIDVTPSDTPCKVGEVTLVPSPAGSSDLDQNLCCEQPDPSSQWGYNSGTDVFYPV